MKNQSALALYLSKAFKTAVLMMTWAAFAASLLVLALKVLGLFTRVGWTELILFLSLDAVFVVAAVLLSKNIVANGTVDRRVLFGGKVFFACAVLLQYNFLIYLVPSRDVWYVSFFFLLFSVVFLDPKLTALTVAELLGSNMVSVFTLGDVLLPARDEYFHMLLAMQVVVVILFYVVCFMSVYLLNRFLILGADNRLSTLLEDLESTKESANRDALTGLFNRRYADLLFSSLYDDREGDRYCVALLDLDDFKLVNDTYGHPCGDQVLIAVAKFIRGSLRKSDYVFRWGGEEFLILLQGADLNAARTILEKLCAGLAEMIIETREAPIRMTATVGVALLDAADVEAGIKSCDERLYQGKRDGKNKVVTERVTAKGA